MNAKQLETKLEKRFAIFEKTMELQITYLGILAGKNSFVNLIQNAMKFRRLLMEAQIIASQPIPPFEMGGVIVKETGPELYVDKLGKLHPCPQ